VEGNEAKDRKVFLGIFNARNLPVFMGNKYPAWKRLLGPVIFLMKDWPDCFLMSPQSIPGLNPH
jgi:hypothetical protein